MRRLHWILFVFAGAGVAVLVTRRTEPAWPWTRTIGTCTRWWPMLLLVAVVPLQIGRARREAAVLRAAFGAEYDRYRSKTWF